MSYPKVAFVLSALLVFGSCKTTKPQDSDTSGSSPITNTLEQRYQTLAYPQNLPIVQSFPQSEIDLLYSSAKHNTISSLNNPNGQKYDPTGGIGYCYGRAMAVNLAAKQWGRQPNKASLANSSIKKLFVVGDMRETCDQTKWRFHVTTIVKRDDQKWIALDPIMPSLGAETLEVDEWVKLVRNTWDKCTAEPITRLYVTPAEAILPDITLMDPVGTEPGTRIINVDQEFSNIGLEKFAYSGSNDIHELNHTQASKYFLMTSEAAGFDFENINITYGKSTPEEEVFSYYYHNYFHHLIEFFEKASPAQIASPPTSWPSTWGALNYGIEQEVMRATNLSETSNVRAVPSDAKKDNSLGSFEFYK